MFSDGVSALADVRTIGEIANGRSQATEPLASSVRYPVELIDVVVLAEGQRVTIRPVLPQDDAVTEVFFRSLSAQSRHNRFMRTFLELPAGLLTQFTHVDYRAHLALIAEVFIGGREFAIGEARYVVSADRMSAEFAVSVSDDWQGQGLGSELLSRLLETARKAGVERVTAETLASNTAMLRLAQKAGFSHALDPEIAGLVHLSYVFTDGQRVR